MKILYGIQLTGNGHITRSWQLISALRRLGADVDAIGSGDGSQIDPPGLKARFRGISLRYSSKGSVDWASTLLAARPAGLLRDALRLDLSGYDLVVSDFEPVSAWAARAKGIPCVGFGNQYSLLSPEAPRPATGKDRIAEAFMRNFAPCESAVALGYQRHDHFVLPPVIDERLLEMPRGDSGFFLAYLPGEPPESIARLVNQTGAEWKAYSPGYEGRIGRTAFAKPDRQAFMQDLAACSGVLTAAGFSTTGEALALGKRLWSVPVKGQYEQQCNAAALSRMGIPTGKPSAESLSAWARSGPPRYEWQDPTAEAAKKITEAWKG